MKTQSKRYLARKWNFVPLRKAVVEAPTAKLYRNVIAVPEYKTSHQVAIEYAVPATRRVERWAMVNDRLCYAKELVQECIHTDPMIRGGTPVLRGTRVPVSLVFANLAENMSIEDIADDLQVDEGQVKTLIKCLAIAFDRPQHEHDTTRRMHELEEAKKSLCD